MNWAWLNQDIVSGVSNEILCSEHLIYVLQDYSLISPSVLWSEASETIITTYVEPTLYITLKSLAACKANRIPDISGRQIASFCLLQNTIQTEQALEMLSSVPHQSKGS